MQLKLGENAEEKRRELEAERRKQGELRREPEEEDFIHCSTPPRKQARGDAE